MNDVARDSDSTVGLVMVKVKVKVKDKFMSRLSPRWQLGRVLPSTASRAAWAPTMLSTKMYPPLRARCKVRLRLGVD